MPTPSPAATRDLDPSAVTAALRRLGRADSPPWLHGEVARRMTERLAIVKLQPQQVVDWWSHLGAGHDLLVAAYPNARHRLVEPDAQLVARSIAAVRRPWWSPGRLRGTVAEVQAESVPLAPGAQLVWANMVLHAVADPPALFARWHAALDVDGFVMFSCLGPGTLRELRALYARLGWPVPAADFVDMHDLGDMLVQAGFADPVMDQETLTLQWKDAPALLRELRSLGGNGAPGRFAGLRTPRWRARLEHELAALAGPDGRLSLSFEIAYGHAFKAAPRVRPGQATTVSLDDMRSMARAPRRRSGA
jgi:malonyl-CoA O-methyltransferase